MKVKKIVLAIVFLFSSIIVFGFNLLVESDNRVLANSDLIGHRETFFDIDDIIPGRRKHPSIEGSWPIENLPSELLFIPEDYSNGIDDDGEGDGFIDNVNSDCNYTALEVIPVGSYIINMGVRPQTAENALLPYGLVRDLLNTSKIHVIWSINSSKSKDGVDFVHESKSFRGAPFIIKKEYLSASVLNIIETWEAKGVIGKTTTSEITVPVYRTLSYSMHWTLNEKNGNIAKAYLGRAEIPGIAYDWVSPENINCCTDVYLMPHSDPTWSTHGNLLTWNAPLSEGGCRGSLWVGCRAVSNLENIQNPSNPSERMNFLMEDPILPETDPALADHVDGSMPPAYKMGYPSDP